MPHARYNDADLAMGHLGPPLALGVNPLIKLRWVDRNERNGYSRAAWSGPYNYLVRQGVAAGTLEVWVSTTNQQRSDRLLGTYGDTCDGMVAAMRRALEHAQTAPYPTPPLQWEDMHLVPGHGHEGARVDSPLVESYQVAGSGDRWVALVGYLDHENPLPMGSPYATMAAAKAVCQAHWDQLYTPEGVHHELVARAAGAFMDASALEARATDTRRQAQALQRMAAVVRRLIDGAA